MFSGIKSMIFGYSDSGSTIDAIGDNNEPALTNNPKEKNRLTNDTSLLEQTLNAATTKFTEQLLPQSASIEQLQLSSHQLLPTLNEQHEEDEFKKRKIQLTSENVENVIDNNNDDDECFNVDSWELLDLVDKQQQPELGGNSLISATVQDYSVNKTGGILKHGGSTTSTDSRAAKVSNPDDLVLIPQRQKPKVSFETPDLVKDKQKIERTTPKGNIKSNSKNSNSKNKQAKNSNEQAKSAIIEKKTVGCIVQHEINEPSSSQRNLEVAIEGSCDEKEGFGQQQEFVAINKGSVLNYAAALSLKLAKKNEVELAAKMVPSTACVSAEILKKQAAALSENQNQKQSGRAIKRNRPLSSSSWSSNDETEAIDSMWNDMHFDSVQDSAIAYEKVVNADLLDPDNDNESILSSGFSDCDYGYGDINDFVMRPKKAQNRKRGVLSNSNSLLSSMSKRGGDQSKISAEATPSSSSGCQSGANVFAKTKSLSTSSKHIKPRKKKIGLSSSANSSDFLKKRSSVGYEPIASTSSFVEKVQDVKRNFNGTMHRFSQTQAASFVPNASLLMPPPPPQPTTTSSSSGNDSSDIAEMDESWYVTPPPCFTGANKFNKIARPKAKEAARENALIEHPSIYISSSSKQQNETVLVDNNSKKLTTGETLAKQRAIVLKKVTKQAPKSILPSAAGNSGSDLRANLYKRKSVIASVVQPQAEKKSAKAWENKFIVTNWNDDEQDDINDFDNLFDDDALTSPTPSKGSKRLPKAKKQQETKGQQKKEASPPKNETPSPVGTSGDYESDFSMQSPVLAGITENSSDLLTDDSPVDKPLQNDEFANENNEPMLVSDNLKRRNKAIGERKLPVQVRPIEPERQPSWQLRKKRSKRRPLSSSSVVNSGGAAGAKLQVSGKVATSSSPNELQMSGDGASNGSSSVSNSARSSPTLIDRIGSSIVANLTNLTSGFPAGGMPIQARAAIEEVEKLNQSVARKLSAESNLVARRRMSKASLNRQNDCVRLANSNRRADRRLKMHTTPNGYSVDRKVHTSFH